MLARFIDDQQNAGMPLMTPGTPRVLGRAHFAFMRALLQGVDERESYIRYLSQGEGADARAIRSTVQWIRDEFAAAAHREARPGTARLVLMDPARLQASAALPSLEEFAAARGMEDFSEQEQAEAYAEAYPSDKRTVEAGTRRTRERPPLRARLIARQLDALQWLEGLVDRQVDKRLKGPRPDDAVAAWLNPLVAAKLDQAGLSTLALLVAHINTTGARWWRHVPGVGALKARRIVEWLNDHATSAGLDGLQVAPHAAVPRKLAAHSVLMSVVPAATALVPFEKLILPVDLNGSAGCFRAPLEQCGLAAQNDHEAVTAWLTAEGRAVHHRLAPSEGFASSRAAARSTAAPRSQATRRAYRKEAERLLLWCVIEQNKPMSSVSLADAMQYRDFLSRPPARWCGPRHHQRWSPQWRPLEGPLSVAAQAHALTVLRALFAFLCKHRYLVANPFATIAGTRSPKRAEPAAMAPNPQHWQPLQAQLDHLGQDAPGRRLARAIRWLYGTDLRLSEITGARLGDLTRGSQLAVLTPATPGWEISVVGTGGRKRTVQVPTLLVSALTSELASVGRAADVSAPENTQLPLLALLAPGRLPIGWTPSGLYKAIKTGLERMAQALDGQAAICFRQTGVQTLRRLRRARAASD